MLVSPQNSCAGYGNAGQGVGAGPVPPLGPAGGTQHPARFPWDGASSPRVLFMCFEDHFCIVRSEEKNILTW